MPVDSPVFSAPNESMKVGVWAKGEALGLVWGATVGCAQ